MDSIKFLYTFDCINCATHFTIEHKSDSIESVLCPICKQDRQVPVSVNRIERVNRDMFERDPITSVS